MVEEVENVEVKVDVRTRGKKGYEDLYELVSRKLENLEAEIAKEFEARKLELLEIFNKVAETYEVPVVEETPALEGTVAYTEVV